MKKGLLSAAIILIGMAAFAVAQPGELSGKFDITYGSKYIWRGFDVYKDKSAIHAGVDLNLYDTGFGVNVVAHRANSDGFENAERWDYTLYYHNMLFGDEAYATAYNVGWMYYNYPDSSSHTTNSTDLQEVHGIFSWPKILGIDGLVPSYCLVKLWPSNSNSLVGSKSPAAGATASGFAHIFMLDYALPVTCPVTGDSRVFNFHSEVVYNDGVSPNGASDVDNDWSNAVFGVTTNFDLGNNMLLVPGVYHQITMDKSVNDDKDETWATVSWQYKF